MRSRTIVLMIFILASVLVATRLAKIYRWGEKEQKRAATGNARMFHLNKGDINVLRIHRGTTEVTLRRENGAWMMEKPLHDKADIHAVEGVLEKIREMRWTRKLENTPDKPLDREALGLEPARVKISFTGPQGEVFLLIGSKAPMSDQIYAALQNEEAVYLVDGSIMPRLENEPDDFRNRQLMPFKPDDVSILNIERNDCTIKLVRDGRNWEMVSPLKDRARARTAGGLIDLISRTAVFDFVKEEPADLSVYGLTEQSLAFTVELKDGSTRRLMLGNRLEGENTAYAATADTNRVVSIVDKISGPARTEVNAFRDNYVLRFGDEKVRSVRLIKDGVSLERKDRNSEGVWNITEPADMPVNGHMAEHMIMDLYSLKILEFTADSPDPKSLGKYGLTGTNPDLEITLFDNSKMQLEIGSLDETGKMCYVMRGDSPHVYSTVAHTHHLSELTIEDMIDKNLGNFDIGEVHTLSITRPGEKLVISRKSDSWHIVSPEKADCDEATLNAALAAFSGMKARSLEVLSAADYAEYNLDPPRFYAAVSTANGNISILVGKTSPEGYYVKKPEEPCVFVVDAEYIDTLDKRFEELRITPADMTERSR